MTKTILAIIGLTFIIYSCNEHRENKNSDAESFSTSDNQTRIKIDSKNGRHVTISNKDSSQSVIVAFDSTGTVLYTSLETNKTRSHSVEYYRNGRPRGLVNLDTSVTGYAIYYYDNGNKKSEGRWENARQVGPWTKYNDKGEIIKIDTLE
jgi:antitoxin component YwqK of YwqJK toxin-antitoxin module